MEGIHKGREDERKKNQGVLEVRLKYIPRPSNIPKKNGKSAQIMRKNNEKHSSKGYL
jgi:hypothetical protein